MQPNAQFPPKIRAVAAGFWLVLLLWLAGLFVVRPWGNFPLNDDWSFGRTVKHLVENHDFHPTEWAGMPLLTNTLWGGVFCLPAGFSFDALRLSTLVAALLGMFGIYALVKMVRGPEWLAVMSALVLGFNPIFFPLSCTFMTDVLFVTLCVVASFFLGRNLLNGKDSDLFIGTALVVLSILSRQLGIAVPAAFAIAACLKRGFKFSQLWRALLPAVVGIVALIIFQHWMSATGRLSSMYTEKSGELNSALTHPFGSLPGLIYNLYISLLYVGLFLLPISFCVLASVWPTRMKQVKILFALSLWAVLIVCYLFDHGGLSMPVTGNILQTSGIGPVTLPDALLLHINRPPNLPVNFWRTVTVLTVLGAVMLLTLIGLIILDVAPKLRSRTMADHQVIAVFLLASTVIYLAPLVITDLMDRYLLLPVALLAAAVIAAFQPISKPPPRILAPAAVVLTAFVLFTVCTTHDYLTWNRARWTVTNDLVATQHLTPQKGEIDGGFEFNGLYFFSTQKSWWEINSPAYMIAFGPVLGYTNLEERQYFQWLPPCARKVMALKKSETDVAAKN